MNLLYLDHLSPDKPPLHSVFVWSALCNSLDKLFQFFVATGPENVRCCGIQKLR